MKNYDAKIRIKSILSKKVVVWSENLVGGQQINLIRLRTLGYVFQKTAPHSVWSVARFGFIFRKNDGF
jgi:hypothetical protein